MIEKHFTIIDSTNDYLKENYQHLDNETIVSTDKQNKGKGRNDHIWESDENNLLFSILLKNKDYFDYFKEISIVTALSIVKVLENYDIKDVSIKWPNDVYVKDKKIAGILLEAISYSTIECLIVGVGINVNQKVFDEKFNATSLVLLKNEEVSLNKVKEDIYQSILNNYHKILLKYDFYKEIKKYDYLKNKEAYALINNKKEFVKVKGINPDYSLNVIFNDKQYDINSGEISFHL